MQRRKFLGEAAEAPEITELVRIEMHISHLYSPLPRNGNVSIPMHSIPNPISSLDSCMENVVHNVSHRVMTVHLVMTEICRFAVGNRFS